MAYVLYRCQSEADRFTVRRKVSIAHIDVGRLDSDAHLAAFVDILHHIVSAAGNRGQQRRHELHRILRLQVRRLIGEQRIRCRVRLVETVARELLHQVEDLLNLLGMKVAFSGAAHKARALLGHGFGILLAHGAPQQVSFTQRVSRQAIGDLHHLLLIDDDAERFLQHRLQLRQFVLNLLAAPLALNEVFDHAALDRSRPVERVQRSEVFDRGGLVAP